MPSRIVREGILTSERINQIASNPACEVFYRRLHSIVDDFGRYAAHPSLLRAGLYPMCIDSITDEQVKQYLTACEAANLILVYEVSGKQYLEVIDFRQQLRTKKGKWPGPDKRTDKQPDNSPESTSDKPPESQANITCIADATQMNSKRTASASPEEKGRESESEVEENLESEFEENQKAPDLIDRLYAAHPNKAGRVMAQQEFAAKLGNSMNPDAVAREIEVAHAAWLPTWQRDGGRFAPRLDRWIREDRYLDAPPDATDTQRAYASEGY